MKRDFNEWVKQFRDSIATWKYYTDFEKVYNNTNNLKVELNILNSLIGSQSIESDFKDLLQQYPNILKVIPILIAKREKEINIKDADKDYKFDFKNPNYSIDEYVKFMDKTGLFDLLQNHIIHSLIDYVMGVEVGMDTNGRKNRTGDAMEDLVESYLIEEGLIKNVDYFKEMKKSKIESMFGLDLSNISNKGKTEKRFDFVINKNNCIYACECNFYSDGGSKLNETARSYKTIAVESKNIQGFKFVWFTDGKGWNKAKHNLEETFDVLDTVYNLNDLDNGALKQLLK